MTAQVQLAVVGALVLAFCAGSTAALSPLAVPPSGVVSTSVRSGDYGYFVWMVPKDASPKSTLRITIASDYWPFYGARSPSLVSTADGANLNDDAWPLPIQMFAACGEAARPTSKKHTWAGAYIEAAGGEGVTIRGSMLSVGADDPARCAPGTALVMSVLSPPSRSGTLENITAVVTATVSGGDSMRPAEADASQGFTLLGQTTTEDPAFVQLQVTVGSSGWPVWTTCVCAGNVTGGVQAPAPPRVYFSHTVTQPTPTHHDWEGRSGWMPSCVCLDVCASPGTGYPVSLPAACENKPCALNVGVFPAETKGSPVFGLTDFGVVP